MKPRRRPRYWILAVLAVLHGFALGPLLDVAQGEWGARLWVAVATLWFLWLIVLTLYPGRTVWKIGALTILVLFALGLFRIYNANASFAFGLPEGFSLVPSEAVSWTRAYLAGRAEAKKDVQQGRLIIEQYGFLAGSGHDVEILRDRYGIEVRATAQCIVDSQILGHAVGYNAISESEIERRYGRNVIKAVFEEGSELDCEDRDRSEQRAKELARVLSSIPPGNKVTLESVSLYGCTTSTDIDLLSDEMENVTKVVHWTEKLFRSAVPDEAPAFESHISAYLVPHARPTMQITSSPPSGDIHVQIYQKLDTVPDVRSQAEHISIGMKFKVEPPG